MTATALAGFDDAGWFAYHAFGVAAAEVEIDCCTGERQLLRADLMFDAGRTVNPAIDLGQVSSTHQDTAVAAAVMPLICF